LKLQVISSNIYLGRFEKLLVISHKKNKMEKERVQVTLVTSRYVGRYGVIQKVTEKRFKIRFWDTGDEAYLPQTSVRVLSDDDDVDMADERKAKKGKKRQRTTKRAKVNGAVHEMLKKVEGEDGVTREEWESIVDKIGKMFI
jgi:hypothetical protein